MTKKPGIQLVGLVVRTWHRHRISKATNSSLIKGGRDPEPCKDLQRLHALVVGTHPIFDGSSGHTPWHPPFCKTCWFSAGNGKWNDLRKKPSPMVHSQNPEPSFRTEHQQEQGLSHRLSPPRVTTRIFKHPGAWLRL